MKSNTQDDGLQIYEPVYGAVYLRLRSLKYTHIIQGIGGHSDSEKIQQHSGQRPIVAFISMPLTSLVTGIFFIIGCIGQIDCSLTGSQLCRGPVIMKESVNFIVWEERAQRAKKEVLTWEVDGIEVTREWGLNWGRLSHRGQGENYGVKCVILSDSNDSLQTYVSS